MPNPAVGTKNVYPYYSKTNISNAGTGDKSQLGKDEFLKILITQLNHQDPMQPLQDKEFIAQMAQFTSVEQLSNMSTELKQLRQTLGFASGIIGKQISWIVAGKNGEQDTTKSGMVESIVVKPDGQYAVVKDEQIALDRISKITNSEATP
ncbi:flagellar hook capping FlgD N-terminal domain-containing protein [Paenibacillus xerothermodurans]|uniref:Flagellar hook capping protein n=1 Tax=Paenibacillus xerothermodurans TaxID=1977292 RepID=A0A2W1NFI3_PAEXE|nr:flagellar hook capping FlgD N-terminal domain-containing protein [Paenibacillus xerothermodurans]PZE22450.1 flagellar hook capping protein [Paenibacillus xerothermodurans]